MNANVIAIINPSVPASNLGKMAVFDLSGTAGCALCIGLGTVLDVSDIDGGHSTLRLQTWATC